MQDFEYCRAQNTQQALAWLRDGIDSKLLAGGQSLLGAMKLGLMAPARLIDLSGVPDLSRIQDQSDGQLRLGAMQTHASLARSATLHQHAPGLAYLASRIADEQVRNRGTLGGSLSNADPSACWSAGMMAAQATLQTDRRSLSVDDFMQGLFSTALEPDEILIGATVPKPRRLAYVKLEQAASRFALVGVAVAQFDDGVRVALNGTSHGTVRLPAFEHALSRRFDPAALSGLRVDESLMSSDVHAPCDYRAHLAQVVARRAVQLALELNP
jgi:carbon-monoxide dehydrogenase medium subunit